MKDKTIKRMIKVIIYVPMGFFALVLLSLFIGKVVEGYNTTADKVISDNIFRNSQTIHVIHA